MWGIWREWQTLDEFAQHHRYGEWCCDFEGMELEFNTRQEAQRIAGMWNALSKTWVYDARPF